MAQTSWHRRLGIDVLTSTSWHRRLGIDCQPPPLLQRLVGLGVALGRLVVSQDLIELPAVMTRQ
jgi:hypothetical protein